MTVEDRGARLRRRRVAAAGSPGRRARRPARARATPIPAVRGGRRWAPWQRLGRLEVADVVRALAGRRPRGAPARRRRRSQPSAATGRAPSLPAALTAALDDPDPLVVVGAAWFLGERRHRSAVAALARRPRRAHDDTRCREAAVAALGRHRRPGRARRPCSARSTTSRRCAGGPPSPWPASTIPAVEPALRRAAGDRDWQVRQAADELLDDRRRPRSRRPTRPAVGLSRPR